MLSRSMHNDKRMGMCLNLVGDSSLKGFALATRWE